MAFGGVMTACRPKGGVVKPSVYTGLNAYWTFNTDGTDSVNGLNFGLVNTPTFGAAKLGNGMTVVGASSQYGSKSHDALLAPTGGLTIAGWVNYASVTGIQSILMKYSASDANKRSYGVNLSSSRLTTDIWNQAGANAGGVTHGTTLSIGTWYFFEVTWNLTTVSINVNRGTAVTGALAGTGVNPVADRPLLVGAYSSDGPVNFSSATFDSIGLWSRALTSVELDYLYNGGTGRSLY